ncbi:hypothetical protein GRX03_02350 [Halovenus sp. WSH3]|uniref:Uncharacterized protein n=1 Tax=Halovenus carboxidivorans TaxID=2692199 RepID=A0A6B0SZJ7_9EURY|nr:hypothetical protein [Halovenus carboxidivorans]MXR50447.1 hypothetical protein [Halovenus carboxidivorans]
MPGQDPKRLFDRGLFRTVPVKLLGDIEDPVQGIKSLLKVIRKPHDLKLVREKIKPVDLELLVTQSANAGLEYYISYQLPKNPTVEQAPEREVRKLFDYTAMEGYAAHELSEVLPSGLRVNKATIRSLVPADDSDGEGNRQVSDSVTREVVVGEELAALITAMDDLPSPWALQILLSAQSEIRGDGPYDMEIRLLSSSSNQSQQRDQSIDALAHSIEKQINQHCAHSYKLAEFPWSGIDCSRPSGSSNEQPLSVEALIKQLAHPRNEPFTVSPRYAVGFLPVPRDLALRKGIGGTASGLEQYSSSLIQQLLTNGHQLGYEPSVGASHSFDTVTSLGLPNPATSVLRVAKSPTDGVYRALLSALKSAFDSGKPTVIFCRDKLVAKFCAWCYYQLGASSESDAASSLEHIKVSVLRKWLSASDGQVLREWGRELFTGERAVYLFTFDRVEDTVADASKLLYELSNAAQSLDDAETPSNQLLHGHVIVGLPTIVAEENTNEDLLIRALQATQSTGLGLELITYADRAKANDQTTDQIVDAVDATTADATGQSVQILKTTTLPEQEGVHASELTSSQPATNVVRLNSTDTIDEPTILPMLKTSATAATPAVDEITLPGSYLATLTEILREVHTIELPSLDKSTTQPIGDALQETAANERQSTRHIPRRTGLPPTVDYDADLQCYECVQCKGENQANTTQTACTNQGLKRAVECCSSLAQVDREQIRRIRRPHLKLSLDEIAASSLDEDHLLFLKILYLVQTGEVDPYFEYSPMLDSGTKIRDAFDLDNEDITMLKEEGYITEDTHPRILYTIKKAGRNEINESFNKGYEYGRNIGELNETLQHQLMVSLIELRERLKYKDREDRRVETYYPIELSIDGETKQKNIDVAVLDGEEDIVDAWEAERLNNDRKDSLIATYKKMCAIDPDGAHWVIPVGRGGTQSDERTAAGLTKSLAELGASGEINYGGTTIPADTPVSKTNITEPGITDLQTISTLQDEIDNLEAAIRNMHIE